MGKFPSCFPEGFEKEILPAGAKEENVEVYRVIKSGTICREAFISTYEEIRRGLIPPKKGMDPKDPGLYSTSCNIKREEAEYALKVFMRHHPKPIIARGRTEQTCGPCQRTVERTGEKNTHVDWWVYENAQPQEYFYAAED